MRKAALGTDPASKTLGGSHFDQIRPEIGGKVRDLATSAFNSITEYGKNKITNHCITSGATSVPLMKAVLVLGCLRALSEQKKNN